MHAVLVHNPTAGSGSHRAEALTSLLNEAGYLVTACSTKECAYKEALKEQADLVLIAGGDGGGLECPAGTCGTDEVEA